jgi:hypothetical protein
LEEDHLEEDGYPGILGALWLELVATLGVVRHIPLALCFSFLVLLGSLVLVGLLPLGRVSVYLQCLSLSFFAGLLLFSESQARHLRADMDEWDPNDPDHLALVAHLPPFLVLAALPLYLAGQAVLFHQVMLHYPAILDGSGWGDAWRLSLNNLLYTEILLDAADVFHLSLAPDPEHRVGQTLVFLTRALLSLAFIRVLLTLGRAAYFRARGLGRGTDYGKALAVAVAEKDVHGVYYAAEGLTDGLGEALAVLIGKGAGPDRDPIARRSLHAFGGWGLAVVRVIMADVPDFAPNLDELLDELERGDPPPPPPTRPWRWWLFLLPPSLLVAFLALLGVLGGWPALGLGVAALFVLGWLLLTPRSSLERGVALGVLPSISARDLASWTLAWAGLISIALIATAWTVFSVAAEVVPGIFGVPTAPDSSVVGHFVLANLLRLQVFFSAPDLFAIAVPPLQQQPVMGSLLTLLFRSALNLGLVAVLLSSAMLSYSRALGGSRLLGNDEMAIRLEAYRGGRFAPELIGQHGHALKEELWDLLRRTTEAPLRRAMVFSGLYDWILEDPPAWALSDLVPTALVAAWHAEVDEEPQKALTLLERVEADDRIDVLFPAERVQLLAIRAQVLARVGRTQEAEAVLSEAESEFTLAGEGMVEQDRVHCEGELALARELLFPQDGSPEGIPTEADERD